MTRVFIFFDILRISHDWPKTKTARAEKSFGKLNPKKSNCQTKVNLAFE